MLVIGTREESIAAIGIVHSFRVVVSNKPNSLCSDDFVKMIMELKFVLAATVLHFDSLATLAGRSVLVHCVVISARSTAQIDKLHAW